MKNKINNKQVNKAKKTILKTSRSQLSQKQVKSGNKLETLSNRSIPKSQSGNVSFQQAEIVDQKRKKSEKIENQTKNEKKTIPQPSLNPPKKSLNTKAQISIRPYFQQHLQDVINRGLKEVLDVYPSDPIKFLGEFLLKNAKTK